MATTKDERAAIAKMVEDARDQLQVIILGQSALDRMHLPPDTAEIVADMKEAATKLTAILSRTWQEVS